MKNLLLGVVLLSVATLVSGCEPPPPSKAKGEARIELFKSCMDAAAKIPRQSDDDVSDIVDECSTQAYYMTNWMR
jgi:hypothetical protein